MHIKQNIKAPRHWPLRRKSTGGFPYDEFPHKGPVTRKMFPFDDAIMFDHWLPSPLMYVSLCHSSRYKHPLSIYDIFSSSKYPFQTPYPLLKSQYTHSPGKGSQTTKQHVELTAWAAYPINWSLWCRETCTCRFFLHKYDHLMTIASEYIFYYGIALLDGNALSNNKDRIFHLQFMVPCAPSATTQPPSPPPTIPATSHRPPSTCTEQHLAWEDREKHC